MKKLLCILVMAVVCISLFGCESVNEMGYTADDESYVQTENIVLGTETDISDQNETLPFLEDPVIKVATSTTLDGDTVINVLEEVFDQNGNCISRISSGNRSYKYIYEYDDNGNKISELYYSDNDDNPTQAWYMQYNENNLLIFREDRVENYCETYEYNEFGNLIQKRYSNSGLDDYYYISEYDDAQNLIKSYREENGVREIMAAYEYDGNGNRVKAEGYQNGLLSSVTVYKYDENGNELEQITTYSDSTYVYSTENTYNEAGQLIEVVTKDNGNSNSRIEYSYDVYGNTATEIQYDAEGKVTLKKEGIFAGEDQVLKFTVGNDTYSYINEYEYNQYGDCIRLRTLNDGEKWVVTETEYEYY